MPMEKGIFECNIGALPKGCRKHERERGPDLYTLTANASGRRRLHEKTHHFWAT